MNREERRDQELADMILREYPPQTLDPWRARVAEAIPNWEAHMKPLTLTGGVPIYTVRLTIGHVLGLRVIQEVEGPDWDEVIARAVWLERSA